MTFGDVSVGTSGDIAANRLAFAGPLLGGIAALVPSLVALSFVLIFSREARKPTWRLIERTVKPG